jgi:hypothetical protein
MTHAQFQDCQDVQILPIFLTDAYDPPIEFTMKEQVIYVTEKLNEIVDAFLETEATHVWFLNADNEVPPNALSTLLDHDVDIASGISPPHSSKLKSTALTWMPPPSPEYSWSKPWFKMIRMKEVLGKVLGGHEIVATGESSRSSLHSTNRSASNMSPHRKMKACYASGVKHRNSDSYAESTALCCVDTFQSGLWLTCRRNMSQ